MGPQRLDPTTGVQASSAAVINRTSENSRKGRELLGPPSQIAMHLLQGKL